MAALFLLPLLSALALSVPRWPDQYTSVWNQYITLDDAARPPYADGFPPEPYRTYQGTTFYDWPNRRMMQHMDTAAFAGRGCQYGNGQCAMLNLNEGPKGSKQEGKPVAYVWMTSGPNRGECCLERSVYVLPPNFVEPMKQQADFTMKTLDEKYKPVEEVVEWWLGPKGEFFFGFFKNRFVKTTNGTATPYKYSAMHGGHQFFNLTGWRWEVYLDFVLGPPPESVFNVPEQCLDASPCPDLPLPPGSTTEPPLNAKPKPHATAAFPYERRPLQPVGPTVADTSRAYTKKPSSPYLGSGHQGMSEVLNGWLEAKYPTTRPCEDWTYPELRALVEDLDLRRHDRFQQIYEDAKDPRMIRADPKDRWAAADKAGVESSHELQRVHRDGLCHHAVLLFVHHLTEDVQNSVAQTTDVPLLSLEAHAAPKTSLETEKGGEVHKQYAEDVRCILCHWKA